MMKHGVLAISIILFSTYVMGNSSYECFAKRGPKGYTTGDFEPFVLRATGRDNLSIMRKIIIGGEEIIMDEQFYKDERLYKVVATPCRIPLNGGRIFYSLGYEEDSKNGYRIDPKIWTTNAPDVINIAYVLDIKGRGEKCVPAIYECVKS